MLYSGLTLPHLLTTAHIGLHGVEKHQCNLISRSEGEENRYRWWWNERSAD